MIFLTFFVDRRNDESDALAAFRALAVVVESVDKQLVVRLGVKVTLDLMHHELEFAQIAPAFGRLEKVPVLLAGGEFHEQE